MSLIFCARCETSKPESAFYSSINRSWCKACRVEYSKAKYAALTPDEKADLLRISVEKRRHRNKRIAELTEQILARPKVAA